MKNLILYLIIVGALSGNNTAEDANEAAKRVIRNEVRLGYNPLDDSEEEKLNATAHNSKMRLDWLMENSDEVSEELRICYALHLIQLSIQRSKSAKVVNRTRPFHQELRETRDLLAKRLCEIKSQQQNKTR